MTCARSADVCPFRPHRHRASPCSQSTVLIPPLSSCISANVRSSKPRFTLLLSPCTMHHAFEHFVELAFNLRLEVGLHLVNIGKFGEGPATVLAQVIHAGHPVRLHGGLLLFGI